MTEFPEPFHRKRSRRKGRDLRRLILALILLAGIFVPKSVSAASTDRTAREGETIVNGTDSGDSRAGAPGEVSLRWYDPQVESPSYTSPDTPKTVVVDHRSGIALKGEKSVLPVTAGDTADLGIQLSNTGNGPDTYVLSGVLEGLSAGWDTSVHLDTDGDSSAKGDPVVHEVRNLSEAGSPDSDTDLVLRVDVPDTASTGGTLALNARSRRTSDPEPGSDTLTLPLVLGGSPDVQLDNIEVLTSDSAVLASGSGTFAVRITWHNDGTADSTVRVDSSGLTFRNYRGKKLSRMDYSLVTSTSATVPAGDTTTSLWSVRRPGPKQSSLLGLLKLRYDTLSDTIRLNVARPVRAEEVNESGGVIDTFDFSVGAFGMEVGQRNSSSAFGNSVLTGGDQVVVMLQQGDSEYVGKPVVNPDHRYEDESSFQSVVESADEKLETREAQLLEERLYVLSLWKDQVGGTYVGDSDVLQEQAIVTIPDPTADTETPRVAKLLSGRERWHVIDQDPDLEDGRIRFRVEADASELGAGFSVFRLLSGGGITNTGSASETLVYPNPFVPFDGRDETGEYGRGPDQGLFFAAGRDVGFPAGTHLAIYTVSGDRVFEKTTTRGGIIRWNPRTRTGEPIASGVYVYRITTPDDSEKVGKFSVVR